jgi:hypothetical protein
VRVDLRVPLGAMFLVLGCILTVYGIAGDKAMYARSLGIDVNLIWGIAQIAFGAIVLASTRLSGRKS